MIVDFNVCADTMTTGSVFHCLRGLPVYIVQRMLAEPLAARHIVVGVPFCVAFADVMLVCGKSVNERSNLSAGAQSTALNNRATLLNTDGALPTTYKVDNLLSSSPRDGDNCISMHVCWDYCDSKERH
jgi:hypothetical protein